MYDSDYSYELYFRRQYSRSKSKKLEGRQDGGSYSSSHNHSSAGIFIKYEVDETLEINDEIIHDQEATGEKRDKKYQFELCTVNTRETDILAAGNNRWTFNKRKIAESEQKLEKRYKCDKCARTYKYKCNLITHQKNVCCGRHFRCTFCGKRFIRKSNFTRHVDSAHKSLEHATVEQFTCNFCGYKSNRKCHLETHITVRHFQALKKRYNCNICSRSYTTRSSLNRHKRIEHAAVKPQFICDFCGHKANRKCYLAEHITHRHLQTSTQRLNCDKCSRSYTQSSALNRHKRLDHAAV
ncbi:zinc finger protein 160-like [Belonocnema kinseyi]|uniref:zinc finger protein 160-like n=1 Tax=Belonocnema kinseyi TaxID=2817044 RepID=UPI00143D11DF|nr:zinc finger protein 160-like [Belonocnema kinseyi]